MPFLQAANQIESIQCRIIATLLPAILLICAAVTFLADLTIALVDAAHAAVADCRVLLGKPAPVANQLLTCRQCIAALQARGIARPKIDGKPANTKAMNELLASFR